MIRSFSKYGWTILLKSKNSQPETDEVSNIIIVSKRELDKIESGRGKENCKKCFRNFLKRRSKQHFSRYSNKDFG